MASNMLFLAVESRKKDAVTKAVKKQKICVDSIADLSGKTPLHLACQKGYLDMVQVLIKLKANINAQQTEGETPLLIAAEYGHWDLVEWLIGHGADPKLMSKTQNTVMHWVARSLELSDKQAQQIINVASAAGADINATNASGLAVIHEYALLGNLSMIEFLLGKGVSVNARGAYNETPLYLACRARKLPLVEFLLRRGALVRIKSKENDDGPLELAQKMQLPSAIIQALQAQDMKEADAEAPLRDRAGTQKLSSKEQSLLGQRLAVAKSSQTLSGLAASLPLDPRFADVVFLFDMHEPLCAHYAVLLLRCSKLASLVTPLKVLKKGKLCYAQVTVDLTSPRINAQLSATEQTPPARSSSGATVEPWSLPFTAESISTLMQRCFWSIAFPAEREREFAALRPGQPLQLHIFRCVLHYVYTFDLPAELLKSLSIVDLATLYATAIRLELEDLRLITLLHWRSMLNDENVFLSLSVSTAAQLGGLVAACLAYCLRNSREFLLRRRHQLTLGIDLLRSCVEVLAAHGCLPLKSTDEATLVALAAPFDDYTASPQHIDSLQQRRSQAEASIRDMFHHLHQSLSAASRQESWADAFIYVAGPTPMVPSKRYAVHKFMLAACSDHVADLIVSSKLGKEEDITAVMDFKLDLEDRSTLPASVHYDPQQAFEQFLASIYHRPGNIDAVYAAKLFRLADRLDFPYLATCCLHVLAERITVASVFECLDISYRYSDGADISVLPTLVAMQKNALAALPQFLPELNFDCLLNMDPRVAYHCVVRLLHPSDTSSAPSPVALARTVSFRNTSSALSPRSLNQDPPTSSASSSSLAPPSPSSRSPSSPSVSFSAAASSAVSFSSPPSSSSSSTSSSSSSASSSSMPAISTPDGQAGPTPVSESRSSIDGSDESSGPSTVLSEEPAADNTPPTPASPSIARTPPPSLPTFQLR